jgi:integrase
MLKRRGLTDRQLETLPRRDRRYTLPDPEQLGLYLRIPARSSRAPIAFAAVARNPAGKQVWLTVGTADAVGVDRARELARQAVRRIRSDALTRELGKATVRDVAEQWLERQVRRNKHRTAGESERIVNTYIIPHIGDRPFADVRRKDIAELLDRIEDDHSKRVAETVLVVFRAISNWYSQRDEAYSPPLVKGMSRVPKREKHRSRTLTDDELRKVWRVPGRFGDSVRLLLLTAQRRAKVHTMRWDDINAAGVWTIRTEAREKGNAGRLKLPAVAIGILNAQPRFSGIDYVFAGHRGGVDATLRAAEYKAQFDKLAGVTDWRLHDLRRTARSLMARAGVPADVAERVLGHSQGELIQIYDRHNYADEMGAALEKLAKLIRRIVS